MQFDQASVLHLMDRHSPGEPDSAEWDLEDRLKHAGHLFAGLAYEDCKVFPLFALSASLSLQECLYCGTASVHQEYAGTFQYKLHSSTAYSR